MLKNIQDKLILLLQCIPGGIQHLLAAVQIGLSRSFAQQHDEAISNAVTATFDPELTERNKLLMQREMSRHGLGLRNMKKILGVSLPCKLHEVNQVNKAYFSQLGLCKTSAHYLNSSTIHLGSLRTKYTK